MVMLRFGEFRIDCDNKRLWRGEEEIELRGLPFATLSHVVQQSARAPVSGGRLFSKGDLHRAIWRDVHVTDETIRGCISQIRRALSDEATRPRYLKTHSGEGWRWLMPVQQIDEQTQSSAAIQPPDSPYEPHWYVERPQLEHELLGCVAYPGRPVVLYGPQGSGKRTLIARATERASQVAPAEAAPRVVRWSLRNLDATHLATLDALLREMALQLLMGSGIVDEQAQELVSAAWSRNLDPRTKLKRLLRGHLLPAGQVVLLIISDIDALVPWLHQAAWFDMLRAWQDDEALAPLRVILSSAIAPRHFPLSEHSPLWTKAARLDVSALTLDESRAMAERHRLDTAAVSALHDQVGGLARLVRMAFFHAAVRRADLPAVLREISVSPFGLFAEHLTDLEQWLDTRSDLPRLLDALRRGSGPIDLTAEQAWPFLRKGILRESEQRGRFVLRCPLYEQRFGRRAP